MKSLRLFLQGIGVSTVAILGLAACSLPNTPQATVPPASAPTTATENVPAPAASAPAATGTQTAQNADLDDLADRVEDALDDNQTLDPFDLDADDEGNSIVLTGRVQTAEQQALAEQIAQQIAPNVSIVNRITVR